MAIGGAAGLASVGITATVVGGSTLAALGISVGIGVGAGMLSYTVETLMSENKEWKWCNLLISGGSGGIQAISTFGIAFAGGRHGLFNNKLTKMSFFDFEILIYESMGEISTMQAIAYTMQLLCGTTLAKLILVTAPAAIIRSLIKKLIKE